MSRNQFLGSTELLDPRTKVIFLVVFSILAILLDGVLVMCLCLLSGLGLVLSQPRSRRRVGSLIILLFVGTWATAYSQGLFYDQSPRTPILTLIPRTLPVVGPLTDGIFLYQEGVLYGLRQSIRFSMVVIIGAFVVTTTQPRDLLLGLVRLGVPFPIAFMVITAIRYLPMLAKETEIVFRSQQLRGARHFHANPVTTLRYLIGVVRPILVHNIRRTTKMSEAIESRSFSSQNFAKRTYLNELNFRLQDWLLVFVLMVSLITVSILKLSYWAYTSGIFYADWLKPFYTFTREML